MTAAPDPDLIAHGPLPAWRRRVTSGLLHHDPAQELAAEKLQSLWHALAGYDPPLPAADPAGTGNGGLLSGWAARFGLRPRGPAAEERPEAPQGLYLVGEVGRGKSMLMDLFFAAAPLGRKRRVHFHRFMQDAHAWITAFRRRAEAEGGKGAPDPIPPLADHLAGQAALLCFDEFQVNDIADAAILTRLFERLFGHGVVVVATSNVPPDELYREGLQRETFVLPFIALLKRKLELLMMDGDTDYRRDRVRGMRTYHAPADEWAARQLDAAFAALTEGAEAAPLALAVLGREVTLPAAARGVGRADFQTLCGREHPLGPADYLAIATHLHTLVLDGIPRLSPDNYDEARRFITLVDALYEHKVKLVCSAAAAPDLLYERGEGARMFERTASRLVEMQSQEYLALPHLT